jgi:hypothetical protein
MYDWRFLVTERRNVGAVFSGAAGGAALGMGCMDVP